MERFMPKSFMLLLALQLSSATLAGQDIPPPDSGRSTSTSLAIVGSHSGPEEVAQMNNYESTQAHESIEAAAQSQASPHRRAHAEATVTVQNSHAEPYDQGAGPALIEIRLNETFTGDMDGESSVRALQVQPGKQYASLVSMQRFLGKVGGRKGTFVLQGSEIVENGSIRATWSVVPGSGTGELSGLRGEGGFTGEFGKGSKATLDYWFE
jgi:uncharacterized protein DUF3224